MWPRPWLAAPAISHEPNKNVFSIGGAARLCCLKKEKKKKTLTALPNPIFFLLLPLTHLLPVATCQHTLTHTHTQNHPVDHVEEGRGVQEESTSFPDLQRNSSQALLWQGERKKKRKKRRRNEQKARWRYQTRRNTYHWFHCWSPRLPLSKCRTSEEDKTYRER